MAVPQPQVRVPIRDVGEVALCYDAVGPSDGPVVLLVAGLGQQLIGFDDDLLGGIARRGWRVVRFDNRDVGWSTHLG